MTIIKGSDSLTNTINDIIAEIHPRLNEYVWVHAFFNTEDKFKQGRQILATTKRASKHELALMGFGGEEGHLIMTMDRTYWNGATVEQRNALVDHELCHVQLTDGDHLVYFIGHDIEEFADVVKRHGEWNSDIRRMKDVFEQKYLPGLEPRKGFGFEASKDMTELPKDLEDALFPQNEKRAIDPATGEILTG